MNNFILRLTGRAYLYLINAYTDAYLSEQLIRLKTNNLPLNDSTHLFFQKRLKTIQTACQQTASSDAALLAIAYTQYYWNGWYDFLASRLLLFFAKPFSRNKHQLNKLIADYQQLLAVSSAYQEIKPGFLNYGKQMLLPLFSLAKGKFYKTDEFDLGHQTNLKKISQTQLAKAVIITESLNISSNQTYIEKIETDFFGKNNSSQDPKLNAVDNLLSKYPQKEQRVLETAIKNTLKAANFWDKLFIKLIKLVFKLDVNQKALNLE